MESYWFSILGLTTSYIFLIGLGISIFLVSIICVIISIYIKHNDTSRSNQIGDPLVRTTVHYAFIQCNNFEDLRRLQHHPVDEEMVGAWKWRVYKVSINHINDKWIQSYQSIQYIRLFFWLFFIICKTILYSYNNFCIF